ELVRSEFEERTWEAFWRVAVAGQAPDVIAAKYTQYGALKTDTGEAVVEMLRPIQARYTELLDDRAQLSSLLHTGAQKARAVAGPTLQRAYDHIGLLPR
ncbi:MAG: tryptophan--tRNA ligase, partial [Ilumatobacteraceae bacterium]|nr:tryptophan--tRNA ligase [Ilumatobacteraceae bacterium]